MRLLLVEDDSIDAERVRRDLKGILDVQPAICTASSLENALAELASAEYDLVLVDLNLPDSFGIETVQRITEYCGDAAVVVLTGNDDEQLGTAAIAAGAQDYLCKDHLEKSQLARTIRHARERNRLHREREDAREEVLVATTKEQLRIGRELHDGVSQLQTAALQKADQLLKSLQPSDGTTFTFAQELVDLLNQVRAETRAAVQGIVPPELAKQGLPDALAKLTEQWHNTNGISCLCEVKETLLVPSEHIAFQLYRISQEALHNAIRHAKASQIRLALLSTNRVIQLRIQDNGCGFDVEKLSSARGQLGIRSMCHRATAIGGKLTIQSQPNRGTSVVCVVPFSSRQFDAKPAVRTA